MLLHVARPGHESGVWCPLDCLIVTKELAIRGISEIVANQASTSALDSVTFAQHPSGSYAVEGH